MHSLVACVGKMPVLPAAWVLALVFALSAPAALYAQVPGPMTGSEDRVEEDVEDDVEEDVEDEIAEEDVEDQVEEDVEEQAGELVLGYTEDILEDDVEDEVVDDVEETVEEEVEEEVVEETVEENVEETVEETVEEQVAETVTEDVEENVEESVEETVEETVAQDVEGVVEEAVEEEVEEEIAEAVEEDVQEDVQEDVAQAVEEDVESGVDDALEQDVDQVVAAQVEVAVEERLESEIDDIIDAVESDLEIDEERIHREQWLVMAEPDVFNELADEGYLFDTVTDLPALGMRLAEVAGPSSFDITAVRRGVLDVVGKDRAEVDLNHIYTAGAQLATARDGVAPRAVMVVPASGATAARIGMIDSAVDTSHEALAASHIESRVFVGKGAEVPEFHGTAVASIIAANSASYQGLVPDAEVFAAGVFEIDDERGEIASTVSLLRALDWLISAEVDVVNISLAGPPNRLLEAALDRAQEQNVVVLAAAGNGGPVASPMYPAAYDSVVAVTAVDTRHQVFRLANRGAYLDLAAPGVDLLHARAGGGFVASSGTSFAVPFAAAAAASLRSQQPDADVMSLLYERAEDLGPPGRDEIYGYGLLRPAGG